MRKRAWWIVLVVGVLVAIGGVALAQSSGGSMGGGSFSGGGGGGGGGGSYSSSGSGGSWGNIGIGPMLGVFACMLLVAWFIDSLKAGSSGGGGGNHADVGVIRIVLDARVRPFVQRELDRIARTADTRTPEGLAVMVREVALLLRRLRDAWVYGGGRNHPMADFATAEGWFRQHAAGARATFQVETVRNATGAVSTAASNATPFPAELLSCPHCGAPARQAA